MTTNTTTGDELQNSRIITEKNYSLPWLAGTSIYGSIDALHVSKNLAMLTGWAFDTDQLDLPLEIIIMSGKRKLGQGKTTKLRPDVKNAGAPIDTVGFRIPLVTHGDELIIQVYVRKGSKAFLLGTVSEKKPLPKQMLSAEDVRAVFQVLFHRQPESEDVVLHQLETHTTKESLFNALFRSPEFQQNNGTLVKILHETRRKK